MERDKSIASVAIDSLRGQAQYDFLMDYFKTIRKEEQEKATALRQTELKEKHLKHIADVARLAREIVDLKESHKKELKEILDFVNKVNFNPNTQLVLINKFRFDLKKVDKDIIEIVEQFKGLIRNKINQMLNSPQIQRNCVQDGEGQSNIAPSTAVGHEGKQGQGTHKPSLTSPEDTNICKCGHDYDFHGENCIMCKCERFRPKSKGCIIKEDKINLGGRK